MRICAHREKGKTCTVLQTEILIFPCSFLAKILTNGLKYYTFNLSQSATFPKEITLPSYSATHWCHINTQTNKILLVTNASEHKILANAFSSSIGTNRCIILSCIYIGFILIFSSNHLFIPMINPLWSWYTVFFFICCYSVIRKN